MADISVLPPDLDAEIDDVLSMLPLLDAEPSIADRVFHRLVDCLVEAVLHDVRTRHDETPAGRVGYLSEICEVVADLQDRGLLGGDGRRIPPR